MKTMVYALSGMLLFVLFYALIYVGSGYLSDMRAIEKAKAAAIVEVELSKIRDEKTKSRAATIKELGAAFKDAKQYYQGVKTEGPESVSKEQGATR